MIYSSTQIKSHDMFVRNNWDNVEPQGKEHMQQLGENHHFCPPSCGYDSPIYIYRVGDGWRSWRNPRWLCHHSSSIRESFRTGLVRTLSDRLGIFATNMLCLETSNKKSKKNHHYRITTSKVTYHISIYINQTHNV